MHLTDPWWVYALRGAGVYLGLLIVLRLIGKRAFGDMTTFDIVVLMLVGSTLRLAITGDDKSPLSAVIGVIPIFLLDKAMGWSCARWPWLDRVVEGKDSLLARGGPSSKVRCAGMTCPRRPSAARCARRDCARSATRPKCGWRPMARSAC